MAKWTYCNSLTITLETGEQSCFLYANGRNSVKVVVSFDPVDENKKPMAPPDIGWGTKTILVDYVSPQDELQYNGSAGWIYTLNSQDYNNLPLGLTMLGAADAPPSQPTAPSTENNSKDAGRILGSAQYTAYILACPDVGSPKSIGIKITTDGGMVYYCAMYDQPNAQATVSQKVAITPLSAISYNGSNTTVQLVKQVQWYHGSPQWQQDNYYFYINLNNHNIQNAYYGGIPLGPGMAYAGGDSGGWRHYHIAWPLGPVPSDTTFPDLNITLTQINSQGPNTLTLTRLAYCQNLGTDWFWSGNNFTIYDQYGNTGNFLLDQDNGYDSIVIKPA